MTEVETCSTGIAEMLQGYSIEVNPNDSNIVAAAAASLDPGTEVFLTWIPGADPVEIVRRGQAAPRGFVPGASRLRASFGKRGTARAACRASGWLRGC
jgi:hypothetical protein